MKAGALLTLLLSLIPALFLFWLLSAKKADAQGVGGAYVCAAFRDTAGPEAARAALEKAGLGGAIGPATPFVFLNDFSALRQVSPAAFARRVLDIDPRNDAFAQEAYRFFVSDGECRFYIPLSAFADVSRRESVERRVRQAAAGLPLAAIYISGLPRAAPRSALPAAVFTAAWLLTAGLSAGLPARLGRRGPGKRTGRPGTPGRARLFPLLVLLPCAAFGAAGCVLAAALLAARRVVLYQTFSLYTAVRRHTAHAIPPETALHTAVCAAVFAAFSAYSGVPALAAVTLPLFFFLADAAALFFSGRTARALFTPRFFPVPIRGADDPKRQIPPSMLIFLAAAFLAAALSALPAPSFAESAAPSAPQAEGEGGASLFPQKLPRPPEALNASAYERHYRFQKTFSFQNLNDRAASAYQAYTDAAGTAVEDTPPVYPLEPLLSALKSPRAFIPAPYTEERRGLWTLFAASFLLAPFAFFAIQRRRAPLRAARPPNMRPPQQA